MARAESIPGRTSPQINEAAIGRIVKLAKKQADELQAERDARKQKKRS